MIYRRFPCFRECVCVCVCVCVFIEDKLIDITKVRVVMLTMLFLCMRFSQTLIEMEALCIQAILILFSVHAVLVFSQLCSNTFCWPVACSSCIYHICVCFRLALVRNIWLAVVFIHRFRDLIYRVQ